MKRGHIWEWLLVALIVALLVVCSGWSWVKAPCGLWQFEQAGKQPARCLRVQR